MKISVPAEVHPGETRVALTPDAAQRLVAAGHAVRVETGAGGSAGYADTEYTAAGAGIVADRTAALDDAELYLQVRKPRAEDVPELPPGAVWLSFFDPFKEEKLLRDMAARGLTVISLEMLPRTTLAQKMDALSSQANIAGYTAVILAAARLNRIFPMMMTPAGAISPARVFVIGAGVAGLQAIATARRLGARVEAYDTRPVVAEQVKSLGAKFVNIDLGATGQTKDGYAKALTDEQLERQRAALAKRCADADVVLTAAQVFGRPAPRIVTDAMLAGMKPGSVVVDMAIENGGNVEGARADDEVNRRGVTILAPANPAGRAPAHASQMFASNVVNFIEHFSDKESRALRLDPGNELLAGCLLCRDGRLVHKMFAASPAPGG